MYTITGATGRVGSATVSALLDAGAPVRAVVRNRAHAPSLVARGAGVAIADFADRSALCEAFRGCAGAFVMLPVLPEGGDDEHRRLADTIAAAVGDSAVPHVVMLSSIGADQPQGTGPIRWLRHLENRLRDTGARVSAIRSGHFQEKVDDILGAVLAEGSYPVFADSADVPTTMIATRDVGQAVADTLVHPPVANEVVDLEGHRYTERQVAEQLAALLGRPVQIVTIPRADWQAALAGAGMPAQLAAGLAQMFDAEQHGLFQFRGDRRRRCTTPLEATLRQVLAGRSATVP